MNFMDVNMRISDEGSLCSNLKYYRRFVGVHLTISPSIWSVLPYEEICILARAANKFHHLLVL